MALETPASITTEHHELHEALHKAMAAGNKTGQAARAVAAVMAPHFEKEEAYAMPPLGLLGPLSRGEAVPDQSVLGLTERLKAEIPVMLEEHRKIHTALAELGEAATAENHPDIARFAERLALHARNEEEVLYPAALLVGEFMKMKRSSWE